MQTPVDEKKSNHKRQSSNNNINPIVSYNDNSKKLTSIKRGYSEGAPNQNEVRLFSNASDLKYTQ